MPIVDLYSARKQATEKAQDVWNYDEIPRRLRVQVSNIVRQALGPIRDYSSSSGGLYTQIRDTVAHEHGRLRLAGDRGDRADTEVHTCILSENDLFVWLDTVELCFRVIVNAFWRLDKIDRQGREITISAQDAVAELNERFRRAGFGYRYEEAKIIRVDSELMHQQVTVPALKLLSDPRFKGADDEFRSAHDHYKAGEYKDCAVDALMRLKAR